MSGLSGLFFAEFCGKCWRVSQGPVSVYGERLHLGLRTEFAWRVTSPFFPSADAIGEGRSTDSCFRAIP